MAIFHKERSGDRRRLYFCGIKILSYKKKEKMAEFKGELKQDKASEVEFYLVDAFEIYHYLPLYNDCLEAGVKARIVAEPPHINTTKSWFDFESAVKILEGLGVDYCTQANENAKLAITTQESWCLDKYGNKKASLCYGAGLNITNFLITPQTCVGFDYSFTHGEHQKYIRSVYMNESQIFTIGYPKHREFFTNPPKQEDIKAKYGISTNKPLLVYFPTWDEDSSIQTFSKAIKALQSDFFIITKAHHCTFRLPNKKDDLATLYEISNLVLEGNSSFEEAAILANIALIDAKSAASTEVLYLNKNAKITLLSPRKNVDTYFIKRVLDTTKIINNPQNLTKDIILSATPPYRKDIEYFYTSKPDITHFGEFIKERIL